MRNVWLLVPVGMLLCHAAAAADACHTGAPFALTYCSKDCPCGEGQGDCDTDAECESGLACVRDVGEEYGAPSYVDVCRSSSAPATGKVFGQKCREAAECEDDHCVTTSADSGFCSRECTASGDCPAGYECAASVCQPRFAPRGSTEAPPASARSVFGAPCDLASECKSDLCAPEGFCTRRCTPAGDRCPVGSTCVRVGKRSICGLEPGDAAGGCSVAQLGSPGPGVPSALVLLCLAALGQGISSDRRRRSSR